MVLCVVFRQSRHRGNPQKSIYVIERIGYFHAKLVEYLTMTVQRENSTILKFEDINFA